MALDYVKSNVPNPPLLEKLRNKALKIVKVYFDTFI